MTWRKTGEEFDNECAHVDMSNDAYRTHMEGIGYLYSVGAMNCHIPKRRLPKILNSPTFTDDVRELVNHGFWVDRGDAYEVVHHGDVIRQSLHAQGKKRVRDKKAQQAFRERQSQGRNSSDGTTDVSADVSADVIADTDRQTDRQLPERPPTTCQHLFHPDREVDPWFFDADCDRCQKQAEGKSA